MPPPEVPHRWPFIKQVVLFIGGLSGFFYETVFEHADRIWLLAFFGGMVGLPFVDRMEESFNKKKKADEGPREPLL